MTDIFELTNSSHYDRVMLNSGRLRQIMADASHTCREYKTAEEIAHERDHMIIT